MNSVNLKQVKMHIIDCKSISNQINLETKQQIDLLGITPGLAIIQIGQDPASEIYINNKIKTCSSLGIFTSHIQLHQNTTNEQVQDIIKNANEDDNIHGIIVQLPIPAHINKELLNEIHPNKDVDGFHPYNIGKLLQGSPTLAPCTPLAIQEILHKSKIKTKGSKITIINRSNIVGKPLASLLMQDNDKANATITICHDQTPKNTLIESCLNSDIIIVAVGIVDFIKSDMIRKDNTQTIIDVGINRVNGKVVGDVNFKEVIPYVKAISKVPGGVGLCTVSMLARNVLIAMNLEVGLLV